MTDRDFEFQGMKFQLNKIDAFAQFHIVRRIGPILSDLLPVFGKISGEIKAMESLSETEKLTQFAVMAQPLMEGLAKLSDEDSNRVLFGLLSSVEMKQEHGNWARLVTGSQLNFQNLDLPVLLLAAGKAFVYNLAGFFGGALRK